MKRILENMLKGSLRRKLLVPLLGGGVALGLVGSWITYQAALDQLRGEFIHRGTILANSIVELVNVSEGTFQGSVGELRLAVEEFVRLTPPVLTIMVATKDPFTILVSTVHASTADENNTGRTLARMRSAIGEGRFGDDFDVDGGYSIVLPLRRTNLEIGEGLVPEAAIPRPGGGTELRFASADYRGAVLLRLDWARVQRDSAGILSRSVGITVVSIILITLFIYVLLHRIVLRPMMTIRSAMERREQGDRAARVEVLANDEIGATAGALNSMLDRIDERDLRFRAFIDHTPSAILLKDIEGRYLLANQCWHEWFNPAGADISGKTVFDFYPDEHAREVTAQDRYVVEHAKPIELELQTPLDNGEMRTTILQNFPVFDPGGNVAAIGGVNTDITDRKQMEKQLAEAQKMTALGQVAGGVAHEFNNMLQAVTNCLGMLELEISGSEGGVARLVEN